MRMPLMSVLQQKNMRDGQLRTNAVRDPRIIAALADVPRDAYVPGSLLGAAYVDDEIPLGEGRFLTEPLAFATMLHLADVQPTDHVLLIGAGYGYSTAVLSKLAAHVVAIEESSALLKEARTRLTAGNTELHQAPMSEGWPAHRHPFNVILIDGGVQRVPDGLLEQLAHNGRLVAIEMLQLRPGEYTGLGQYLIIKREHDVFATRREGNAFVALLPGFTHLEGFHL